MHRPVRHRPPRPAAGLCAALLALTALSPAAMADQTQRYQITAGADDAEEDLASGAVDLTSSDLEVTEDDPGVPQLIGLRFSGMDLPQGLPILGAYLQFTTDEDDKNLDPFAVTIQGEASADATAFTEASQDISARARTTAQATWSWWRTTPATPSADRPSASG